jgi:hypothetical protein
MTSAPRIFNPWQPAFRLPEGAPLPHAWRLRNLAQLARRAAHSCGYADVASFLTSAEEARAPGGSRQQLLLYTLVLQLCCNCWTIQTHRGQPQLDPSPPPGLVILKGPLGAPGDVSAVGVRFATASGGTCIAFRGTFTPRESLRDVRALLSTTDNRERALGVFVNAYKYSSEGQPSLASQVRGVVQGGAAHSAFVLTGHSMGAALAHLAAQDVARSVDADSPVAIVSWGAARSTSQHACLQPTADGRRRSLNVINAFDTVPFLHSLRASTCQCCPLVLLNASPSRHRWGRLITHDILYYGYALLLLGSVSPLQLRDSDIRSGAVACAPLRSCLVEVTPSQPFRALVEAILSGSDPGLNTRVAASTPAAAATPPAAAAAPPAAAAAAPPAASEDTLAHSARRRFRGH